MCKRTGDSPTGFLPADSLGMACSWGCCAVWDILPRPFPARLQTLDTDMAEFEGPVSSISPAMRLPRLAKSPQIPESAEPLSEGFRIRLQALNLALLDVSG